jgi:hypothetical protein
MDPHEYSGFARACERALSLVNETLDTPEGRRSDTIGSGEAKSRTAIFVEA